MSPFVIIPKRPSRPGIALAMALILLTAVAIIVATLFDRLNFHIQSTSHQVNDQAGIRIAESGIEKAVWCLNNPNNTTDCPGNPNFIGESNVSVGNGTFTTVVSGSGNSRTITSNSTVPGFLGSTTHQLQVTLTTTNTSASFQYGVQSGEGGISLDNNAKINGNAYTNGSINGSNGSSITGDAVLAVSSPTTDQVSDPTVSPLYTKNFGDASSTTYLAQSFVSDVNDTVYSIDLKVAKHNSPTTSVTLYIYSDNSGNPGTNLSGSGQDISVSIPNDSPAGWENGWTNQLFSPATILLPSTTYWLVMKVSSSNSSKYWTSVHSFDDTTYANGTAKVGSGTASMTALNYDLAFQINTGGQTPTLNIPTIGGNAYSHTITNTTVTTDAYYQALSGTVTANNNSETCALSGGTHCHPGSPDQPPQNFPISSAQITQMESQAAAGGTTTCSPTCTLTDGSTIGPRKYVGDVVIDANNGHVYLGGTLWVAGNLTITNGATFQLAPGYGTNSGTIVIDDPSNRATKGTVSLSNNANLTGNYASCTGSPKKCGGGSKSGQACTIDTDCPNGNYIMAISMNADPALTAKAIDVSNNLSAGVLYAPTGLVDISNNANLNEVTAQKIHLNNNCQITYQTGLASVIFTSGPGGSWVYQKGSYQITN